MDRDRAAWKAVSLAAGAGAGVLTRALLGRAWRARMGTEPPGNPADPHTPWPQALIWAASVGVAVGVGRLVSLRVAAGAWEVATDELPPGVTRGEAA